MYNCAKCGAHGCMLNDPKKARPDCPTNETELQARAAKLYNEPENMLIAHNAALTEADGYCRLTRMEEIIYFFNKCGCKKIGLAFCVGFAAEAKTVERILSYHGFEVTSVACKNGSHPKRDIGITPEHCVHNDPNEVMCNPIGQALLLNNANTDFNLLLGLCVGHDSLVIKYLEAPVTVLAVKDRVTGHNPLAPIYLADGYYHSKLFPEKPEK